MHNYELVFIIHPDLDEEAINQALGQDQGLDHQSWWKHRKRG